MALACGESAEDPSPARDAGQHADAATDAQADGNASDAGDDGAPSDARLDAAADAVIEGASDASIPLDPSNFYTRVPSTAGGAEGIAIRVEHPGTLGARYADGAPTVVVVPGGHTAGDLNPPDAPQDGVVRAGLIRIELLFPGGSSGNWASGGTYDYRGPSCQQAVADVVDYAAGQRPDADGLRLQDRVPFAMTSIVGAIGQSNGGNVLLQTIQNHANVRHELSWIVTWESPLGPQYVNVELGRLGKPLNPFYVPGTAQLLGCPWPGMETELLFDPNVPKTIVDPHTHATRNVNGIFCLDQDHNGLCGPAEYSFPGMGGPGPSASEPRLYHSLQLTHLIANHQATVFGSSAWPPWLADAAATYSYWQERDGALAIEKLPTLAPDLPWILGATVEDHVQGQPDHPHVRVPLNEMVDGSLSFVRCNPDASYLAALTGLSTAQLPENAANTHLPWPGTESHLLPEEVAGVQLNSYISTAAQLELSDRVYTGELAPDLAAPLVPVDAQFP